MGISEDFKSDSRGSQGRLSDFKKVSVQYRWLSLTETLIDSREAPRRDLIWICFG